MFQGGKIKDDQLCLTHCCILSNYPLNIYQKGLIKCGNCMTFELGKWGMKWLELQIIHNIWSIIIFSIKLRFKLDQYFTYQHRHTSVGYVC